MGQNTLICSEITSFLNKNQDFAPVCTVGTASICGYERSFGIDLKSLTSNLAWIFLLLVAYYPKVRSRDPQ